MSAPRDAKLASLVQPTAQVPFAERGFVFAATGHSYAEMAIASAMSLRAVAPDARIWLYTDHDVGSSVFDRVVAIETPWRRSKIDAMLATPFERTVYIDADTIVVADVSDLFDLLERFDIALAHDQERNSARGTRIWRSPFPASFPQFNSGVIAYRRSAAVMELLTAWRDAVWANDHPHVRDQPSLRELLWESDLRIATLPPEYNFMDRSSLFAMKRTSLAPRIIHHPDVHRAALAAGDPRKLEKLLGSSAAAAVRCMIAADRAISERTGRPIIRIPILRKLMLQIGMIARAMKTRITSM